jgi:hypothetical protein
MRGEHCLCHKTLFTGSPQKSEIRALLSYHQTKIVHVMLNFPSFFSRLNEFKPEKFEVEIKNDTHGQREQPTFGGVSRAPPEASQNGRRGDGGRAAEDGQAVGRHGGGPRLPRPSPAGALPAPSLRASPPSHYLFSPPNISRCVRCSIRAYARFHLEVEPRFVLE